MKKQPYSLDQPPPATGQWIKYRGKWHETFTGNLRDAMQQVKGLYK
jgi:hypothetical protein